MKRYSPGLVRRNDASKVFPRMYPHDGGHYFKCDDVVPRIEGLQEQIKNLHISEHKREQRLAEVVSQRNQARSLLQEVLRNVLVGVPPELEERIEQYLGKK